MVTSKKRIFSARALQYLLGIINHFDWKAFCGFLLQIPPSLQPSQSKKMFIQWLLKCRFLFFRMVKNSHIPGFNLVRLDFCNREEAFFQVIQPNVSCFWSLSFLHLPMGFWRLLRSTS